MCIYKFSVPLPDMFIYKTQRFEVRKLIQKYRNVLLHSFSHTDDLFFSRASQLKEFQQKGSPATVGGDKGGGSVGGVGAKKKRKMKGPGQLDAPSSDRNSPVNVSYGLTCLAFV